MSVQEAAALGVQEEPWARRGRQWAALGGTRRRGWRQKAVRFSYPCGINSGRLLTEKVALQCK